MKSTSPFGGVAAVWLALGLAVPPGAQAKVGLAARFGDVILENAKPGRTYNLREAARVPFGIENRGDAETDVVIQFQRPHSGALAKDYEAIPDPDWFKALPDRMRLPAKGMGFSDILVTIPDDPALIGKNYQVLVLARSVSTNGSMYGVAIHNRIRLSIGQSPESAQEEKRQKAMKQMDFDVKPKEIYLLKVPLGRRWDARKEAQKSIRVANYAPDRLELLLSVDKWDRRAAMPSGYEELPDLTWLKVAKATVTVEPEEIGIGALIVDIPDKPEHRGKKWAATVRTGLTTGFWLDAPVKVYVETQP